jgi:hypothetical protein
MFFDSSQPIVRSRKVHADGMAEKTSKKLKPKDSTMKKFFATLLTIVVSCSFAGNIVYDYKASIKRLEPVYSVKKINKKTYVTDAYKTVSDTIVGYIVVPACRTCIEVVEIDKSTGEKTIVIPDDEKIGETYVESTELEWQASYGYFIRKGDKLSKNQKKPFIAKTTINPSAAMFGAYTPMTDGDGAIKTRPYADVKANKYAWMSLSFVIPASEQIMDSKYALKKYPGTDINYGFLGFDNKGTIAVDNAGFGTIKVIGDKEAGTLGFCSSTPDKEWSCQMVYSIAGSTVGAATYAGPCEVTPMWDVCYDVNDVSDQNDYVVTHATIHGTWTLKYNKSLSSVADTQKEAEILKKLGGTSDDIYPKAN